MAEKRASTVTKIYKITLQEKLCNKYNCAAKNCDRQQSGTTPEKESLFTKRRLKRKKEKKYPEGLHGLKQGIRRKIDQDRGQGAEQIAGNVITASVT